MERLTARNGDFVTYQGRRRKYPGYNDEAGNMRVAAVRECMQRLADYEDTGLSPEQITDLLRNAALKN